MSSSTKHNQKTLLAMFLLLFAMVLTQGCGTSQRDCEAAQDSSKITINPSSQPIDTGGFGLANDVTLDWEVRVGYPDGTPMPHACLNISGAFAVPNGYAAYQFQFYPSWVTPNAAVDSGFRAKTDDNGQYTFSTLISAGTGTFKDTIFVRSGTNVGTAEIEIK